MLAAPITPTEDSPPVTSLSAQWSSTSIPYNEAFEDSIMNILLHQPSNDGVTALGHDHDIPLSNNSDIDSSSFPNVDPDERPLPLNDPRRTYRSLLPGLRLTQPHGSPFGGAFSQSQSLSDISENAFTADFIRARNIRTKSELHRRLEEEKRACMRELRERMQARQEAIEENRRVDKEIKALVDQREMEVKIERRMREMWEDKRRRKG